MQELIILYCCGKRMLKAHQSFLVISNMALKLTCYIKQIVIFASKIVNFAWFNFAWFNFAFSPLQMKTNVIYYHRMFI